MTEQDLLKLYRLRGAIKGLRTGAKCGIRSADEALSRDGSEWLSGWLNALLQERVNQVRNYNHLYNEVTDIMKGAESE